MIDRSRTHISAVIHELAHVENAAVGAHTKVWQFASIIRNARIGDECNVGSCAILDGAAIGNRCLISHGAFIGPGVMIHDDVFVGPQVSMCNDFWPLVDKTGWFNMGDLIAGGIVVSEVLSNASIGANAVVLPGVTIGRGAMISAGAVVSRNVPDEYLWRRDGSAVPIATYLAKRMRSVSTIN